MEMKERIERMASTTWDVIGGDILQLLEDAGEPPILTRDEVIQTVCDASYMEVHGQDKDAYAVWDHLPSLKKKLEAVSGAFPCERYGW